jgi:hypothetical protein
MTRKNQGESPAAGSPGAGGLGAGAEAATGVHGADGKGAQQHPARARDAERPGSEPLDRDREHASGYGGEGGSPRTSAESREPRNPS